MPSGDIVDQAPELCRLDAGTLAGMIKARQVSSREVISAFLDHVDVVNPVYNALVSLRPREEIVNEAEAADAAVARGDETGPLHGLPQAPKDLALTRGLRTTFGSPIFADFIPDEDTLVVARMRKAGAIFIGKTNTPEFGFGSHTYNPVFGVTGNAYDPAFSAGGSSGGGAVALATRMLPVADGSDFGGSLRNPAGWNNIFGFRPSQGRVPSGPALDLYFAQMSIEGPMARTIEDLKLLLDIQAGYDPRAPLSLDRTSGSGTELPANPRIAWFGDLDGHLACEPGILALCEDGLKLLEDLGCRVDARVPAFDWERLWQAFITLRRLMTGAKLKPHHDNPARRALLKPEAVYEIEGCLDMGAWSLHEASETRSNWYKRLLELFDTYDFVALPTAQVFPFPVAQHWPQEIDGRPMDTYHRWMEVASYATLAGCPAISLPVGFSATGLPSGMQLIGRPRADDHVLAMAERYEKACPWLAVTPSFPSPA